MKTLSTAGQAAIASGMVPMAVLVSMAFTTPLNLCTSNIALVAGGVTYTGVAGLGKIGAVQTTPAEIKQLEFQLSGVPTANLALVLTGSVQGVPVSISLAILNPATYAVTDVVPIWSGQLDTLTVDDTPDGSTITVTAEHIGIDLNRPAPSYYADADQQALHPGDLFFQYTSQQFDQQIVWPAARYFAK